MPALEFDGRQADELLEFVEGEGSCILAYDAGFRLYDLLCERGPGEPCRWTLQPDEAKDMADEVEDCADGAWAAIAGLLATRLRALASGA